MTQTQIVLSCSLLRPNVEVKNPASSTIVRVRQAARHGPPNDIAHEFALHARVIRLQREEKRRMPMVNVLMSDSWIGSSG